MHAGTTARSPNLESVKALLVNAQCVLRRGWCQHSPARDESGAFVGPEDARACAFSPVGALMVAAQTLGQPWDNSVKEGTALHAALAEFSRGAGLGASRTPAVLLANWNDSLDPEGGQL